MIVASAVKHCGKIFQGRRHHNAIHTAVAETGVRPVGCGDCQGFINDKGEYLTRVEAGKHAIECGQIDKLKFHDEDLFSEDLW